MDIVGVWLCCEYWGMGRDEVWSVVVRSGVFWVPVGRKEIGRERGRGGAEIQREQW